MRRRRESFRRKMSALNFLQKGRCKFFLILFVLSVFAVIIYLVNQRLGYFDSNWPSLTSRQKPSRFQSAYINKGVIPRRRPGRYDGNEVINYKPPETPQQSQGDLKFQSGMKVPPPQLETSILGDRIKTTSQPPVERLSPTTAEALSRDLTAMHRLIHLDLKGAPPKPKFYQSALPFFKEQGATGLLIEYEDMFPYSGGLLPLKSDIAYSKDDLAGILSVAKTNNLEVIPLVQTFGHLEFVLKNNQFEGIREVKNMPQNLNPGKEESLRVVTNMLDQVLALHPDAKWIHIGCDEVYYLGKSPESQELMRKKNLSRGALFLHHVVEVAKYVKEKYPKVKPIIWDDKMRWMSIEDIQRSGLPELVEPMVWKYTHDLEETLPMEIWAKYAKLFKELWAASSFKGATGPAQFITNHMYHLENHRQWKHIINMYIDKGLNFRGVALTGWQRYDHFGTLCELLPAAMPCLSMCLKSLQVRRPWTADMSTKVFESLGCQVLEEENKRRGYQRVVKCEKIPGDKVYIGVQRLNNVLQYYTRAKESAGAWFNEYLVSRRYLSPGRLYAMVHGRRYNTFMANMTKLENYMAKALSDIYDNDTVTEWLDVNIWSKMKEIKALHDKSLAYLNLTSWQRRPLPLRVDTGTVRTSGLSQDKAVIGQTGLSKDMQAQKQKGSFGEMKSRIYPSPPSVPGTNNRQDSVQRNRQLPYQSTNPSNYQSQQQRSRQQIRQNIPLQNPYRQNRLGVQPLNAGSLNQNVRLGLQTKSSQNALPQSAGQQPSPNVKIEKLGSNGQPLGPQQMRSSQNQLNEKSQISAGSSQIEARKTGFVNPGGADSPQVKGISQNFIKKATPQNLPKKEPADTNTSFAGKSSNPLAQDSREKQGLLNNDSQSVVKREKSIIDPGVIKKENAAGLTENGEIKIK